MKSSIVISTAKTNFRALAYQDELAETIRRVAELGFDGVELAVRSPADVDLVQLKKILAETKLMVSSIGTGQIYGEEGLSFTDSSAQVRRKTILRIKSHIDFATQIGNPLIIIGLVRGATSSKVGPEEAWRLALSAVRECAVYGKEKGVRLAIEPINRYETDLINTIKEGCCFIDELGEENVGILADTFHMNIEEPSMELSIKNAQRRISHLHIADSNRWAPGYGHINFSSIIEALHEIDYQGFISAEILPKPSPDQAANQVATWMRAFL